MPEKKEKPMRNERPDIPWKPDKDQVREVLAEKGKSKEKKET